MTKILATIGIIVTVLYGFSTYILLGSRIEQLQFMVLNEVGDFFAGIFGPIAIFWLILGFLQQGIELQQNTKALELQAEELKNSVEQQRELVQVSKQQFDAELEALRYERTRQEQSNLPKFIVHGVGGRHHGNSEHHFRVRIKNVGHSITAVTISANRSMRKLEPETIPYWENGSDIDLGFEYENWMPEPDTQVSITYTDGLGRINQHQFDFVPNLDEQNPSVRIYPLSC